MVARASSHDPYRAFKFRIRINGETVAGISKVSNLSRTITPTEIKEGGDLLAPRQNPGAVSYDEVMIEWGLSLNRMFETWANAVTSIHEDPAGDRVRNFKRTVYIDVYDLAGKPTGEGATLPVFSYKLHRCWVSKYTALPDLDAGGSAIGIQSASLIHEGWERVT